MSWLARSLANTLKFDEGGDAEERDEGKEELDSKVSGSPRGVREDLSELTKTLTRQLWGVASFLAPPPERSQITVSSTAAALGCEDRQVVVDTDASISKQPCSSGSSCSTPRMYGIRNDIAEIGGRVKTGISKISTNRAVTEISRIASSLLPFGPDELEAVPVDGAAVGVTGEVLTFARNISMHPETWLDFPLFVDGDDSDDFDMSDAQQEHALAVERLAPRLAALRIELCPRHMSEGCFWKIYFVLVYSRLNKHDAELLSTSQIAEARAMLLQALQNRRTPTEKGAAEFGASARELQEISGEKEAPIKTAAEAVASFAAETGNQTAGVSEMRAADASATEEASKSKDDFADTLRSLNLKYDDDGDDWLEGSGDAEGTAVPIGNEEDVSFSDLEEDDDGSDPASARATTDASESSKGSREWVQLGKSSRGQANDAHSGGSSGMKEASDWLSLDEIDVA